MSTEIRYEPLAEIRLSRTDANECSRISCLCSRIFIRNNFDIYASTLEREAEASELETDVFLEKENLETINVNPDCSQIPIPKNTEKFRKTDEGDGYFSASHTDTNYCSTDEHENIFHPKILHSSDSGADISEQHLLEKRLESLEKRNSRKGNAIKEMSENDLTVQIPIEQEAKCRLERNNSLPELFADEEFLGEWEKYWGKNGESLIWASWIEKYSDYINPDYLCKETEGDDVTAPPTAAPVEQQKNPPSKFSFEPQDVEIVTKHGNINEADIVISPAKRVHIELMRDGWNQLSPASIDETYKNARSCQENDKLLSPRCESVTSSIPFTLDSMTNVTHMTISSYDFCSSRVSSDSSSSVSSVSSYSDTDEDFNGDDDDDNDKCDTQVINDEKTALIDSHQDNTMDVDQYWQILWQKHFQEQYAIHYREFINAHTQLHEEMSSSFHSECGGFPESCSIFKTTTCKRKRGSRKKKAQSLQKMVANLNLVSKHRKSQDCKEPVDGSDTVESKGEGTSRGDVFENDQIMMAALGLPTSFGSAGQQQSKRDRDDDEKDPRKNRGGILKRTHESDPEESNLEKVKATFEMMGFNFAEQDQGIVSGDVVYRKKHVRLHNRMLKINFQQKPKHIYFDEDGNEISDNTTGNEDNGVAACVIHSSSDEDMPPSVIPSRINSINFTQQLSSDANANEDETADGSKMEVNLNSSIDQENESNCVEESTNFDDDVPMVVGAAKKEKRRKRKNKFSSNMPAEIASDKSLKKFWYKRFSLFSMYDLGIKLDRESWFSVTPEKVAIYTAERCRSGILVDAFCGCGGNTIQFAKTCSKVIAIDIDAKKIEMAKHNAAIYGVADKIEFIVGNYMQLADKLVADVVFLSPPWGGPQYMKDDVYDLETSLLPVSASKLIEVTKKITGNIAFYVPRNSNTSQLAILAGKGRAVEVEQNFLDRKLIAITAYYGNLVNQ